MANDDLSGCSAGLVVVAVEVLPRQCATWQSIAPVFTSVKKGRIPSIERRIPTVRQKADPAHRRRDGISCLLGGAGLAAGPIVRQDFPSAFFVFLCLYCQSASILLGTAIGIKLTWQPCCPERARRSMMQLTCLRALGKHQKRPFLRCPLDSRSGGNPRGGGARALRG